MCSIYGDLSDSVKLHQMRVRNNYTKMTISTRKQAQLRRLIPSFFALLLENLGTAVGHRLDELFELVNADFFPRRHNGPRQALLVRKLPPAVVHAPDNNGP